MHKLKTILLILFVFVIVILIFFLVKNSNGTNNQNGNTKMISEIKYMDTKLTSLINSINGVSLENYKVSATKTSTNSNSSEEKTQSQNSENGGNSNTQNTSNSSNSQSDNSENSGNQTFESSNTEQYELKGAGVLTNQSDVDWELIKNEVELLYSILPTITLDLYSNNINQSEILSFNKELDELTIAIKDENKEQATTMLANLYRYLPVYASNLSNDTKYVSILETKLNIFNAYVFANRGNWQEVKNYTSKAIENYSAILNNISNKNNDYDVNKIYIILNELQNAANTEDIDVFTIKYKTFLEQVEKNNK